MKTMCAKIAEAHDCSTRAMLAEIEAHAAAFSGDAGQAKDFVRAAIAAHRDAINLLVAALPDRVTELRSEAMERDAGRLNSDSDLTA